MITNSTGRLRGDWPSEGTLVGNARTPGIAANCGMRALTISCCLRLRSAQGFSCTIETPSLTVGNPAKPL